MAGVAAHHRLPLLLRHKIDSHVETLGERHLVLGFVVRPCLFILRAAHQESPRWNPSELHAETVGEDLSWLSFGLWRMNHRRKLVHLAQKLNTPNQPIHMIVKIPP